MVDIGRTAIVPPAPAMPSPQGGGRWLLPGVALAGSALYALYRGGTARDEQEARMLDLANAREHDLSAPLPSMTVKESHEAFAQRKLASLGDGQGLVFTPATPKFQDVTTNALALAVADIGIKQPVNALTGIVKKKLYTEPKQRRVFDTVLTSDPELARSRGENPEAFQRTYNTLKTFAPSLALDPNAVKHLATPAS